MDLYEVTLGSGRKTVMQLTAEDAKRWASAVKKTAKVEKPKGK